MVVGDSVRARKNLHLRAGFHGHLTCEQLGPYFMTRYRVTIRRLNLARDQFVAGESALMGSRSGSHRDGCHSDFHTIESKEIP